MIILGENNYKEYLIIKNEIINFIINELFYKLKIYFNNSDIVYIGSLIYKKLNINNKKFIKDIDISINNKLSSEIINKLKNILDNINIDHFINKLEKINYNNNKIEYSKKLIKKRDNKYSYILIDGVIGIDIFINEHNNKIIDILYINDDIYTHFFGYEWILETTYNLYKYLKINNPKNCDKIIKTMKMINRFNNNNNNIYQKINNL